MPCGAAILQLTAQILSHGWANKASQMEGMAYGLVGEMRRFPGARDVIVITLDQRGHGKRRDKNKPDPLWWYDNPGVLVNMVTFLQGAVQDHQLIMDNLASYIFPAGERRIAEWMSCGVSLGGHVQWRLLLLEPRIRVAVPICSVPSDALHKLQIDRFVQDHELGNAVHYPPDTQRFYMSKVPEGTYVGKKILALNGTVDDLCPPEAGDPEWGRVVAEAGPGSAVRVVYPNVGHIVTPPMVRKTAEWLYRWGVRGSAENAARL